MQGSQGILGSLGMLGSQGILVGRQGMLGSKGTLGSEGVLMQGSKGHAAYEEGRYIEYATHCCVPIT
jgi:hypothetical protein